MEASVKDSLRHALTQSEGLEKLKTYQLLAARYFTVAEGPTFDTLMTIYDDYLAEARRQNRPNQVANAMLARINTYQRIRNFDEVLALAPPALEYMASHEEWAKYYDLQFLIINTYDRQGHFDKALAEANRMYTHARDLNNPAGMALMLYSISDLYYRQRRYAEQEEPLRQSIALMTDIPECANHLPTLYTRLISSFNTQKRTDEARELIPAAIEAIHRYEKHSGSHQSSAWNNLWDTLIGLGIQSGDYDMAELYLNKLDSLRGGVGHFDGSRANIQFGRGQYAEALESIEKDIVARTSANISIMSSLGMKLMIQIKLGDPDGSYNTFVRAVNMLDSVNRANAKLQVDELRTQYEVDRHIAEKERNRNYYLLALAGCLLLFIILGVVVYYNRIIRRKNRHLYRQLKEQDQIEQQLHAQPTSPGHVAPHAQPTSPGCVTPSEGHVAPVAPQRELTERLRQYLLAGDNLSTIDINRDELVAALGISRNTLADAVRLTTGKTLMEYIRSIQLSEARRMLDQHPELTVEAVATDCGFKALNTFYRLFRKNYGISPAEYRRLAAEEAEEEAKGK